MVLLNPISSAIKLGFRSLFAFASSTQVRWSILLFQNSILASFPKFLLTDDEFLPKWNAHTIQVFQAGLTNDFVTSEIDDHAHRMLKHLITKHLQVWTNTNKTANTYRNSRNNQNSITYNNLILLPKRWWNNSSDHKCRKSKDFRKWLGLFSSMICFDDKLYFDINQDVIQLQPI